MVKKYRRTLHEVEAIQCLWSSQKEWLPELEKLCEGTDTEFEIEIICGQKRLCFYKRYEEGRNRINLCIQNGDYIIKYNNTIYPMKELDFENQFRLIIDENNDKVEERGVISW